MSDEHAIRVIWSPRGNRAQVRLLKCQVFEIFFGGARGGGKTDGVLGEFGAHASRYGKDAIGLMVRRTRAELVETIERSRAIYGAAEMGVQRKRKDVAGTGPAIDPALVPVLSVITGPCAYPKENARGMNFYQGMVNFAQPTSALCRNAFRSRWREHRCSH